jgi:hypothetical protein
MATIAAGMSCFGAFVGRVKKKNDGILSSPRLHPFTYLNRRRRLAVPHWRVDPCLLGPDLPPQPRHQGRGHRDRPVRGGCPALRQRVLGRAGRDLAPKRGGGSRGEEGVKGDGDRGQGEEGE